MTKKEILKDFDNLINNLSEIIPVLNRTGSRFVEEQQYQAAKAVISKAEMVLSLQSKVKELRDTWLKIVVTEIGVESDNEEDSNMTEREKMIAFKAELHLSNNAFRMPILQALVNLGGSAKRQSVFDELEKIMGDQLTENDCKPLPSNERLTRWQRNATNTRTYLLDKGDISVNARMGIWKITEKGRKTLKEMES